MNLNLSDQEALSLLGVLNRLFEMGSYDTIFLKQVDEIRTDKIRRQLRDHIISLGKTP